MWKQLSAGLSLLALCGCIKIKDALTLQPDGSGSVRIETVNRLPAGFAEGMSGVGAMGGMGDGVMYPPISEAEARKFFPEKDFTVTVTQKKADNGDVTNVIEATFKDVNALLASPYGKAHQLTMKIANGSLVVQGVSGMEATARFAEMKSDDLSMGMSPMPGFADFQKKTNEMRAEFRIMLPNPISAGNGERDGKTAAWIFERAKSTNATDFAQQLGAICEVMCPADGLKMSPVSPVRLGLKPFEKLTEGDADAGKSVDTNKIAAAAKFVPYGLTVTRSLDLSGEGGSQQSAATLVGAVTLPTEFAPQKWGEPQIAEIVDAKGNDLKMNDNDQERGFMMRARYSYMSDEGSDEEAVTNTGLRHVVALTFRPPDWKVAEIARIKGSLRLQYFGGSQVAKLTNAIPSKWIVDPKKMMSGGFGGFDSSEKPLASDRLATLGLSLSVQMGMAQGGMTMLTLQTKGADAALTDAQVFDAHGRPWPTFLPQLNFGGGDSGTCEIIVAGSPEPPLSLAVVASGNGSTVDVPISLEHVSISK